MIVEINGKSNLDYNMDFIHREISSPAPKTNTVSIPFSDSVVDVSELDGHIHYENRQILMQFELRDDRNEWMNRFTQIRNEMHGKIVKIIFFDDPRFYWEGRADVSTPEDNGATCTISVTVDAFPYKKTVEPKIVVQNVTSADSSKHVGFDIETEIAFVTCELSSGICEIHFTDGDNFFLYSTKLNKFYGKRFGRGHYYANLYTATSPTLTFKVEGGEL